MNSPTVALVLWVFVSAGGFAIAQDGGPVPRDTTVAPQPPAPPRPLVSPEVYADRRVTFRVAAPEAGTVVLTGEFLRDPLAMQKDDQGVWSATVGPVPPEEYYYNFLIAGVRTIDPGNPNVKTGSTPSTIQSVLKVDGDAPAFFDAREVPHGVVHERWYHSKSLQTLRRMLVYTPPGYHPSRGARLPVLYLLHGANGNEAVWMEQGRANAILDNLIADGETRPLVVVMPFGYGEPPMVRAAAGRASRNTELFGRDLVEDVIPYVESAFRVRTDRDHRALAGLSMGGGQSLTIGLTRLDLFSHVAGFSGAVGNVELPTTFSGLIADPAATNRRLRLLWVGCGREDRLFAANERFVAFLGEHDIRHTFRATDGAHTWAVWRRYLHELVPLLFVD